MNVRNLALGVGLLIACAAPPSYAWQLVGGGGPSTGPVIVAPPPLRLAPIDGLTTAWHDAPAQATIPLGTLVTLEQPLPPGAVATWTGVDVVTPSGDGSMGTCLMTSLGTHVIEVVVDPASDSLPVPGVTSFAQSMTLLVVNVPLDAIDVSPIRVDTWVPPIDATVSNADLVALFFGPSIAPVLPRADGGWVTSVERPVALAATAGPALLRPAILFDALLEWRVGGEAVALGPGYTLAMDTVGEIALEVGPPGAASATTFLAYSASIVEGPDALALAPAAASGAPLTFVARTDPPGFEPQLQWFASTKWGGATPLVGQGAQFVTSFSNSVSARPTAAPKQWVGVKVANATIGADGGGGQPPAPDAPVPDMGGEGTFVTITGANFPSDPQQDACVMLGPNASLFVGAGSNQTLIVGEVQFVPPGAQPGVVTVLKGTGTILEASDFIPVPGIVYGQARLFESTGGPSSIGQTVVPFTPTPTPGALGWTLSPADGGGLKASMTVTAALAGQCAQIWALFERQNGTSDLHMCEIQITQNLSANQVAVFLCSTLLSAFGSVPNFTCLVTGAGNTVEISLPALGGIVNWQGGVWITACAGAPNCAG